MIGKGVGGGSRFAQKKMAIHFNLITTRQRSWGKVMFSQVFVYPRGEYLWYQVYPARVFPGGGYVQGVTHPLPIQTWDLGYNGIRSTNGRYAPYWDAFLFRNYVDSFCNLVKVYWMFTSPSSAWCNLNFLASDADRHCQVLVHTICLKLIRPVFSKFVLHQLRSCNWYGIWSLMSFIM